jgi:uncharacterized cupredoxin-like copper-binding protein
MRKFAVLFALLALVPFSLAACGGDDDEESSTAESTAEESTDTGGGGGQTITVSADPSGALAFEESSLTAKEGSATFEFTNDADLDHDFCIEEEGTEEGCTDLISGGDTATLEVDDLGAGEEYTFYCSVSGHREGGMEGDLTVE